MNIRSNWTREEVKALYARPLLDLAFQAAAVHREHNDAGKVQMATLLSIKTGGCSENCSYCPQSSRHDTGVKATKMLDVEPVLAAASAAKEAGSTRFCMGVAWREARDSRDFDKVCDMVRGVKALGMEPCCTLGMLNAEQAQKLKDAGLHSYNHNLDTSERYYPQIITSRTYQDRLDTLDVVREAGINVCSGGIVGMGETEEDRIDFLHTYASMEKHPDSLPLNALIAVAGTPLEDQKPLPALDFLRMVATARILMPKARIRLSAGRHLYTEAEQGFFFLAGANSIHTGGKLLVTPCATQNVDAEMLTRLGLQPLEAYSNEEEPVVASCGCSST